MAAIRLALITKEWPPKIYGGAGVHVKSLHSALVGRSEEIAEIQVHCFDGPRSDAHGYSAPSEFPGINPALSAMLINSEMLSNLPAIDIVHSHTWYANFAGDLARRTFSIPHVLTAHSLEPRRPWKAEQLGPGYKLSSWIEENSYRHASAIIAVSDGMREDLLDIYPFVDPKKVTTIRNGVDSEKFAPNFDPAAREKYGIQSPYVIFVGRITRQKGLIHLLRAWRSVSSEIALVIAAGSPDDPSIGLEVESEIENLRSERSNIYWIKEMLPHEELTALLTQAEIFVCPSIYEPLGIVNLEAMSCETAVVASAVGGIPEVVMHGVSGDLVVHSPIDTEFESDLAQTISLLMNDEPRRQRYAKAGRQRVINQFSWNQVADETIKLYQSLL